LSWSDLDVKSRTRTRPRRARPGRCPCDGPTKWYGPGSRITPVTATYVSQGRISICRRGIVAMVPLLPRQLTSPLRSSIPMRQVDQGGSQGTFFCQTIRRIRRQRGHQTLPPAEKNGTHQRDAQAPKKTGSLLHVDHAKRLPFWQRPNVSRIHHHRRSMLVNPSAKSRYHPGQRCKDEESNDRLIFLL
jgi:hypothetical protein